MGRSKRKKQESKTENFSKPYRNLSDKEMLYGSTYMNYRDHSRQGFRDAQMLNSRYESYAWYTSNRYPPTGKHSKKGSPRKSPPPRPSSPVLGSEEYMVRKIQQTSAIIMKQLLNPNEQVVVAKTQTSSQNKKDHTENTHEKNCNNLETPAEIDGNKNKNKKVTAYDIENIHQKIMNHITNLNDGKKKNLINSNTSGYDTFIQQIQKQKRLEISRALRDMCSQSNETQESSDFINSIIPDIGIKIEDLPHDLIEQLRNTLDFDCENPSFYEKFSSSYFSLGETQIDEGNVLSKNRSVEGEPSHSGTYINLDITDTPLSFPHDKRKSFEDVESHTETYVKPEISDEPVSFPQEKNNSLEGESSFTGIYIKPELFDEPPSFPQHKNTNFKEETLHTEISLKSDEPPSCPQGTTEKNINEDITITSFDTNSGENNKNCVITVKEEYAETENSDLRSEEASNITTNLDLSTNHKEINVQNVQGHTNLLSTPPNEIILTGTEKNQDCVANRLGETSNRNRSSNKTLKSSSVSTQTQEKNYIGRPEAFVESFLANNFKRPPESISQAIKRMLQIDKCISKLTKYRQSLFDNFKALDKCSNTAKTVENQTPNLIGGPPLAGPPTVVKKKKKNKKKKKKACSRPEEVAEGSLKRKANDTETSSNKKKKADIAEDHEYVTTGETIDLVQIDDEEDLQFVDCETIANELNQQALLKFQEVQEKMLVIKVVGDKLMAAAESGKIFFCSLEDGHFTRVLEVSKVPITSLLFIKVNNDKVKMYVGSYETNLKIYDFESQNLMKTITINDNIQCMENNWGYIFIGCIRGSILRYSLKNEMVEYEDKFSDNRILVLKATQEGARRILVIGSQNSPVCIRDAMTGLYMRTMEDIMSPTVYSLIMEKNLIYCGTTNHDILVFSFHDGKLIRKYNVTGSRGIGCMKIVKNLLFASCHNGSIYVYDINCNTFIDSIKGPGGVILSMEILENQVIVGTMSCKFKSIEIPQHILRLKRNRF